MTDFSAADALERYLALLTSNPELGANPEGVGIELLTSRAEIALARAATAESRRKAGLDTSDTRVGVLTSDPHLMLLRDAVRFADGSYGLYNRIIEHPAVGVIPMLDGNPVAIRLFRHSLRRWTIEFPRGAVSGDEDWEAAARREIAEEIGARVLDYVDLGTFTPGGSTIALKARLGMARIDGVGALDPAEGIAEALVLTPTEVAEFIRSDKIIDGFTIALFTRAKLANLL